MLAKVYSGAILGLDAIPIEVEVDIAAMGLPSFTIVGLPDKAVEEAKERVRAAIRNSGADFPARKITVNLAPADLPKEGPSYDLPIAVGILLASEQLKADVSDSLFVGELSLNGNVRHTNGILSHVIMAKKHHFSKLFVPAQNASEAAIIDGVEVYPIENVLALFYHLSRQKLLAPHPKVTISDVLSKEEFEYDFADIKGQEHAKRALEIAAAGSHNILLKGPPGAGKTLLAKTLPSILPTLTFEEALEVTKIYSTSGMLHQTSLVTKRPFRNPHHTTSHIGLIGGSATPKPGEISLAHKGVLFLDEFPEFPRFVLEALRQPIEDGFVTISRAHGRITFPTKCMLVAAQNPCPCGFLGDKSHSCSCNQAQISRYQKKISGPLLDRIDIHLEVPAVKVEKLTDSLPSASETSQQVRKRVQKARDRQLKRFAKKKITANSEMSAKDLQHFVHLSEECKKLLKTAISKLNLSARSYHRTIKLSQTIADLEGSDYIKPEHIAESLQYRPKFAIL